MRHVSQLGCMPVWVRVPQEACRLCLAMEDLLDRNQSNLHRVPLGVATKTR